MALSFHFFIHGILEMEPGPEFEGLSLVKFNIFASNVKLPARNLTTLRQLIEAVLQIISEFISSNDRP